MKILDVTLRDGGFVNGFALDDEEVAGTIALLDCAEIDAIEIGYLTGLPPNHGTYPRAGICYAWSPRRIAEVASAVSTPLVGMLHPNGPVVVDLVELSISGLTLVRVPVVSGADTSWRKLTARLADLGLPFSINLTLATWSSHSDIAACARAAEDAGAAMFYVADTNSAFLPQDVENLFTALGDAVSIPLGFHAHECKGLAHANVIAARRGGALWIDASLAGFGRGAGNAATEVVHELAGKQASARHRLLRGLPDVAAAFGVVCADQLWQRLCAFIDLWPPAIELFESIGAELGMDKYSLVSERVLGNPLPQPPTESDLRELVSNIDYTGTAEVR